LIERILKVTAKEWGMDDSELMWWNQVGREQFENLIDKTENEDDSISEVKPSQNQVSLNRNKEDRAQ
jgi:hypothetical protein